MAKKLENLNVGDVVAEKADFDLNQSGQPTADYVSSLFTSVDTSTDPAASGLLSNAKLDKGIVKVASSILPIPLEEKTGSFTAEDAHAYAVTMSAGITLTFPTVPSGNANALIFQARFSNGGDADLSVTFNPDGQTVKFDGTDCGVVKAGKSALLSAMWNGAAWDLVWKNQA